MKNTFLIIPVIFLSSLFLIACEKEENNEDKLALVLSYELENITQTSVVCGGKITNDRGFEIIDKGICWSEDPNPDIESNIISASTDSDEFYITLTGLTPDTQYFLRAYATNKFGTSYGTIKNFKTLKDCPATVMDADGNVYQTVFIGNQCWMAENLKTTKYSDGSEIYHENNYQPWINATNGLYCYYSNNYSEFGEFFGGLYNGHAVLSGKICPENWKVPSSDDWKELVEFLGGESVAGGKLKEEGTAFWHSPNNAATNQFGFSARGGGYRHGTFGNFDAIRHNGYWWSSTINEDNNNLIKIVEIDKNTSLIHYSDFNKNYGISVRCILE